MINCLLDKNFKDFIFFCENNNIPNWKIKDKSTLDIIMDYNKFPIINTLESTCKKNGIRYSKGFEPISWLNSYKLFYHIIKRILEINPNFSNARIISEFLIPYNKKRIDILITYENFLFIYELSYLSQFANEKIRINKKSEQIEEYINLLNKNFCLKNINIIDYTILISESYIEHNSFREDVEFFLEKASKKDDTYLKLQNPKNPKALFDETLIQKNEPSLIKLHKKNEENLKKDSFSQNKHNNSSIFKIGQIVFLKDYSLSTYFKITNIKDKNHIKIEFKDHTKISFKLKKYYKESDLIPVINFFEKKKPANKKHYNYEYSEELPF